MRVAAVLRRRRRREGEQRLCPALSAAHGARLRFQSDGSRLRHGVRQHLLRDERLHAAMIRACVGGRGNQAVRADWNRVAAADFLPSFPCQLDLRRLLRHRFSSPPPLTAARRPPEGRESPAETEAQEVLPEAAEHDSGPHWAHSSNQKQDCVLDSPMGRIAPATVSPSTSDQLQPVDAHCKRAKADGHRHRHLHTSARGTGPQ